MSISNQSNIIHKLAAVLGNILVFLFPKKASELSKNRITLIHKNKNNLNIPERLMRFALVNKLDKIQDYDKIAEMNRNFWVNKEATELFSDTEDKFENDFLPNCSFVFDLLKKELLNESEEFDTLVEIGTGNGEVLNYLSAEFPQINRFVGIDLSSDQIEINKERFSNNKRVEFVTADASDWVNQHGSSNTIFVSSDGVLEYFLEQQLQEFLNQVYRLGKTFFVAIEPNGVDHNFETNPNSQLYGKEPSFSHNYPKLFKNAGFNLWHFSQKTGFKGGTQTFVGAKY
ncbi:class I SAM-dependent methyltransferase [Winogradskyella sp. F6397]|uniref:Class I SAM-dependent methyltransferase n=1 Tax=Winogradskyella marina TaxID=2785530 RepID=A0ABS0EJA3_9FLAO|nr:class I SAM-dependent methyltransferase [Winogradskyella marina]MBF8150474.1 class I SAM-dependent methyltransferase [Winogradskyella marina]